MTLDLRSWCVEVGEDVVAELEERDHAVPRLVEDAEHVAQLRRPQRLAVVVVEAEVVAEVAKLQVAEHPRPVGVGRVEEVLYLRREGAQRSG